MKQLLAFFVFVVLTIKTIKCQTGGTTPTGDSYVCVPSGFCNNGGNSNPSPGIDPRIVTPGGQNNCPAGQIPCITQGPNSQCGNRFIQQTSTVNGPANPGAYPWQAYLRNSTNSYAGSGVLIDNYHILTAAHKVVLSENSPQSITVFMGVADPTQIGTNPTIQNRTVARVIIHPSYNRDNRNLFNDIAILRVATPFALSQPNINSACLPPAGTSYVGQQNCVVAGWGQTQFNNNDAPTNPMKQVYVNIIDYNTCRTSYSSPTLLGANVDQFLDASGGEICAGGQAMRDACTQDGGAPLICPGVGKGSIAGLVIWGKNCGQPGVYGVYVSVPYYRGWIDTTLTSLNAG